MQLKWKRHELNFLWSSIFIVIVAKWLTLEGYDRTRFQAAHVPFDSFRNVILPLLLDLLPVGGLITVINLWMLPKYDRTLARRRLPLVTTPLQSLIFLTLCFSLAFSFRFEFFLATMTRAELTREAIRYGIQMAFEVTVIYALYLVARERAMQWILAEHPLRPFRILVSNRTTFLSFRYLNMLTFVGMFGSLHRSSATLTAIIVFPVGFISMLVNAYAVFPQMQRHRLRFGQVMPRLIVAPLLLTVTGLLIFTGIFSQEISIITLLLCLLLIIGSIPVSWLVYIQQKDDLSAMLALETKLLNKTADLASLRAQVNPHFLFNTLNSLYGTAMQEQASKTAEGIQRLGDMMRFMLHDEPKEFIALEQEIRYLQDYIALQRLRLDTGPGLRIDISITDNDCGHQVAPMLLMPFVENAFKHGIRLTTGSFIEVKLRCDTRSVFLEVNNSIHPVLADDEKVNKRSGTGLYNVKERLRLIYPHSHELEVDNNGNVFRVKLRIDVRPLPTDRWSPTAAVLAGKPLKPRWQRISEQIHRSLWHK